MDIERYKRLTIPKIEAGKITKIVRDAIKADEMSKQDVYEQKKEEVKPITEKLEKEIDEISKLREEAKEMQIVPYYQQIQKLSLPGPDGEQTKIVSNMDKGFTPEEFAIMQTHQLPLPSKVLVDTMKDSTIVHTILEKSGKLNHKLGLDKAHVSTTKKARKNNKAEIDEYTRNIEYSPLSKTVFNDLNRISEIPIHRTSKKYKQIGNGVVYYNDPRDLLSRLELLGGSIAAGNDGVKDEFAEIVHTLNKLGVLNHNQLNDLLKQYIM